MAIIYAERTVVRKGKEKVVEVDYYRDEKKISAIEFLKALKEAYQQQGEDLYSIYDGV